MAKYTTKVICGISFFVFRKLNNAIMREFAILFSENGLKQLKKN